LQCFFSFTEQLVRPVQAENLLTFDDQLHIQVEQELFNWSCQQSTPQLGSLALWEETDIL
jgi:hypothetical protein